MVHVVHGGSASVVGLAASVKTRSEGSMVVSMGVGVVLSGPIVSVGWGGKLTASGVSLTSIQPPTKNVRKMGNNNRTTAWSIPDDLVA